MPDLRTAIVVGVEPVIVDSATGLLDHRPWRLFATTGADDPDRIRLDKASDESVSAAIDEVVALSGGLDAILILARTPEHSIEATGVGEAGRWFEDNLVGLHRLSRAALPFLRVRKGGRIVVLNQASAKAAAGFGRAATNSLRAYLGELSSETCAWNIRCELVDVPMNEAGQVAPGEETGIRQAVSGLGGGHGEIAIAARPPLLARYVVEALEPVTPSVGPTRERRLRLLDRRRGTWSPTGRAGSARD